MSIFQIELFIPPLSQLKIPNSEKTCWKPLVLARSTNKSFIATENQFAVNVIATLTWKRNRKLQCAVFFFIFILLWKIFSQKKLCLFVVWVHLWNFLSDRFDLVLFFSWGLYILFPTQPCFLNSTIWNVLKLQWKLLYRNHDAPSGPISVDFRWFCQFLFDWDFRWRTKLKNGSCAKSQRPLTSRLFAFFPARRIYKSSVTQTYPVG